jgi:cytochrome c biogenesis protein
VTADPTTPPAADPTTPPAADRSGADHPPDPLPIGDGPDPSFGLPDGTGVGAVGGDGLPDDVVALSADWGSARRRRATGLGPRLGPGGWLRWGWRQLTSMRTALVLLFLLAIAAIPGSVLPQRGADPLAVNRWIQDHPSAGAVLDRLGVFDTFASPWFSAIYLLLFVSLVGCVLPRIGAHWRAMRQPTPPAPRRLDRLAGATTWTTTDPGVLAAATQVLRAGRWRVTPGTAAQGSEQSVPVGSLAAEKGFARETGNLLFHIALVLILLGVAAGALFGWKGTVIVREGKGFSNTLTQFDSFSPGRLASPASLPPFSFTMTDFDATFEREGSQRGAPRSFAATLDYTPEPGAPVQSRTVSVNSPLALDGARVHLVGHGYAPHLRISDSTGQLVFDDTAVFLPQDGSFTSTGVVKLPDATPQLGFTGIFAPTAAITEMLGPHSTFPAPDDPGLFLSAFTGDLGLDTGQPSNIFQLDTEDLERLGIQGMRPGDTWELPGGQGTVEFVDVQRWASFTISNDPGKLLALIGSILAIVGLMLSLFVKRRRIWVRVEALGAGPGSSGQQAVSPEAGQPATVYRVQVAGLSRTDSADVVGEVTQLVARLDRPETEEGR